MNPDFTRYDAAKAYYDYMTKDGVDDCEIHRLGLDLTRFEEQFIYSLTRYLEQNNGTR